MKLLSENINKVPLCNCIVKNKCPLNDTTFSKSVWDIKEKCNKPQFWSDGSCNDNNLVMTVPSHSNTTKKCLLCLYKKSEIFYYPNTEKLLNKWSEWIAKCCHGSKYLLCNYKSTNWNVSKNSWRLPRDVLED